MAIITLTTDWGIKDHYLASVKGSLLSHIENTQIIDITHDVLPFDVYQASFIFKNSYQNFPDGTIHIIGVNSDASIENPHIAIKYNNQYFIGADNGVFSLIFGQKELEIVEIDIFQESDNFTFSTKDVFVKAAQIIDSEKSISNLGPKREKINRMMSFEPVVEIDDNSVAIIGKVIYIDRYENAITNISEELFRSYAKNKKFDITFNTYKEELNKISKSYLDVPASEMCAIFDSNGLLEISINQGNAGSLLGLKLDSRIRINIDK
jgi:S-adenosylmethionine hydrolase